MNKIAEKKKDVASKMSGHCSICGRNHDKSMHAKKGYASLNPAHKSQDNMSKEGRDEEEKE